MSAVTAPQVYAKATDEVRTGAVSFNGKLESGEVLSGAITTEVSPSGLTVDNVAITTGSKEINGVTVATGRAITFRATGGTAGTVYTISFKCGTSSSPAQTVKGKCKLEVTDE